MVEFSSCLLGYSPVNQTPSERSELVACLIDSANAFPARDLPGQTVLVKSDFSLNSAGEVRVNPLILRAVAEYFLTRGARVLVGDSPLDSCLRDCGAQVRNQLAQQLADLDIEWLSFEESSSVSYIAERRVLFIANAAAEADLVINVADLRIDQLCQPYGAMANLLGLLPGFQKIAHLVNEPGPSGFPALAVDLLAAIGPDLSILTVAASDSGNQVGQVIGVSPDTVALDSWFAHAISGENAESSPMVRLAADAGLGIGWPELVTVHRIANFPENITLTPEVADSRFTSWPSGVVSLLSPFIWSRPRIEASQCRLGCVVCSGKCPTSALEFGAFDRSLHFHQERCINCWRCREVCPSDAIAIEQSPLLNRLQA